jgi:predicted regulator of Ras-like GTPase activity (Roadblock/LC7/MglB family)
LLSIDDDAMDRLFADNLGVKDTGPPPPKVNVNEAVQSIRQVAEVAGQNMAPPQQMAPPQVQPQPMAPPPTPPVAPQPVPGTAPPARVEGVGRLATHADTSSEAGSGKIASIGKFLLDQQDLSKIGNIAAADLSDSKMRILTLEAAQELQNLLSHIQQQPGVVGSVIVGHDGILIANSMPQDLEAESIGVWALGVYLNTDTTIKRMGHNHVHQAVCRTPRGYLIIADFGGGILVTLSDGAETERLIPLMRSITQLVSH